MDKRWHWESFGNICKCEQLWIHIFGILGSCCFSLFENLFLFLLSLNKVHIQQSLWIQLCYCGSEAQVETQIVCCRCRLLVLRRKPTLLSAYGPTWGPQILFIWANISLRDNLCHLFHPENKCHQYCCTWKLPHLKQNLAMFTFAIPPVVGQDSLFLRPEYFV